MTSVPPPVRTASVLPWALVFKLIAVGASLLVPAVFFFGPAVVPAMAGLSVGLAGGLLGRGPGPLLAAVATLTATAALLLSPGPTGLWLIGALLIAGAGVEACTIGGRAFVLALYGWVSVLVLPTMPPPETALPFVALGLGWGLSAVHLLHLGGRVAQPPARPVFGVALMLFLLVGLGVAVLAMRWADAPLGYWIVLLFIFRAIAPPGQTVRSAIRFGLGAAAGCGLAVLVTPLQLPPTVAATLASGLFVIGLRYLPHPAPWSATAFTAAILLAVAPGPESALFRLEAALFVVALTASLAIVIEGIWRLATVQGGGSNA